VLCLLLGAPHPYTVAALAASLLIIYKHIPNIKRLRQERELAFGHEGRSATPAAEKRN
jgi:hypothetical protein